MKLLVHEIINLKNKYPLDNNIAIEADNLATRYSSIVQKKRTDYYTGLIKQAKNKGRCMWKLINTELGRGNRERADFTDLVRDANGHPFISEQELVNAINEEFATAALLSGAPTADSARSLAALSSHTPPCDASLRFKCFTPDEIVRILQVHISPKNSADIYDISANLLKFIGPAMCEILAHLFNEYIRQGMFPSDLKKVRITPLYKAKGRKAAAKSYRPISLVPALSKVLEVGLNQRLTAFLAPRNILSERQYAYRQGRSTTDLVREVVQGVLEARERRDHVAVLCCDLSRAFDTADHRLLADKLGHYGIRGRSLSLLTSFMSGRVQVVVGDKGRVVSSERENVEIYMFADDVTAVITARSLQSLENKLNSTLRGLYDWFQPNGLALNKDKTNFLLFNLNGQNPKPMSVLAGNTHIDQVASARLLGFHLDSALTWERHIDEMCTRLSRACFALNRLASTAGGDVVRSCYFATVHSVLTYGTELWARAGEWERVFSLQKRAIRAMARVPGDVSAREYFKEFKILTLPCLLILQVALFTHTNLHIFARKGVNKTHNLRGNKDYQHLLAPPIRLAKSERSVYHLGPKVYNRLPESVRDAPSAIAFKTKLKKWLLQEMFYDVKDFLALPPTQYK
ncbi:reverse transcriptase (RNA-dependent DNA polymerase) domain-containing protein [Phthorimaea operculella]|nr:reverse transcriptase (RNA-dependent DNA polymerase) domain-containing protein [Phthorimaea operculella]